ncbi:hypothetical protein IAD21_01599 [Abditibacteriota bacterium]|nr:hypothetical protein IAD21_01599 [Abditibacteriota bacterium]
MKFNTTAVTRRVFAGLFATALVAPFATPSAFAHIAPCPYCAMTITQDTPTQDNEVALRIGRKRIEYKCVYCALAEAQTEYQGDLTVIAPSEKKGEPILISRKNGQWSAPDGACYVLNAPVKHKVCQEQARAFTSKEVAQKYLNANKDTLPGAKIVTLPELVKVSGA